MRRTAIPLTFALFFLVVTMDTLVADAKADPQGNSIVGSPACPILNAHGGKACRFRRNGHDFQVWPRRLSIVQQSNQSFWHVGPSNSPDGMFDHTKKGPDDHITFDCYVGMGGKYYGPFYFRITNSGVVFNAALAMANTVSDTFDNKVTRYFGYSGVGQNGTGGAENSYVINGGPAVQILEKETADRFGNNSWQVQGVAIAKDICAALAN